MEVDAEHRLVVSAVGASVRFSYLFTIVLLAGTAAGCAAGSAEKAGDTTPEAVTFTSLDLAIYQANEHLKAADFQSADLLLQAILVHPSFSELKPDLQYEITYNAGYAARKLRNYAKALPLLKRASEMPQADYRDWLERFFAAYGVRDMPDAIGDLLAVATRKPDALEEINETAILRVVKAAAHAPTPPETNFQLHDALFEAHWLTELGEPSWMWVDLARMLAERGQVERARLVVSHVESPEALIRIRIDRRFDVLALDPATVDIPQAFESSVKHARQRVAEQPGSLLAVVDLTYTLLAARQFTEVLDLTAPFSTEQPRTSSFVLNYKDWDDQILWVLNNRARALRALGRAEEAVPVFQGTARKAEHGDVNVSQALNLGDLFIGLDRPQEALAAVVTLGDMTPYGAMVLETIRLSAALAMGDAVAKSHALDYLRSHRSDSPGIYQTALLRCGLLDEAAKVMLARLEDPEQRSDALNTAQNYYEGPPISKREGTNREVWNQFINRPDVKTAVEKVGRVEDYSYVYETGN